MLTRAIAPAYQPRNRSPAYAPLQPIAHVGNDTPMPTLEWLATAVLTASPSGARVAAALARLPGAPFVDGDGRPRLRVTASTRRLEDLAGISRPSVITALAELDALGLLERLSSSNPNRPGVYSLPRVDDAEPPHPATLPREHAQLVRELEDLGVNGPMRLMSRFGFDSLQAATERLQQVMLRTAVRSPGGLLLTILTNGMHRPKPKPRPGSAEYWEESHARNRELYD